MTLKGRTSSLLDFRAAEWSSAREDACCLGPQDIPWAIQDYIDIATIHANGQKKSLFSVVAPCVYIEKSMQFYDSLLEDIFAPTARLFNPCHAAFSYI